MAYSKVEQVAYDISESIANKYDCYIYDVEYVKEGSVKYLRIYADRENGISIDDCEKISRDVSAVLDVKDPIKENYILEVSSPGIERKLTKKEHFDRYIGEIIDINLFKPYNGSRQLSGKLNKFDDPIISLVIDDEIVEINQKEASVIKLHFDF